MVGKSVLTVCVVLAAAGLALGEDVNPAPWEQDPGNPEWEGGVTTAQMWEFSVTQFDPNYVDNPFGQPEVTFTNAMWPERVVGPHGWEISTWHIGPGDGGVTIFVPNNPDLNKRKVIWLQMTSDKAPAGLQSNPPGTVSHPEPAIQWPNGTWYTYTARIDIDFNPACETITYDFPECTNISEIVVKTICVPEPMTLGLLGLGGLGVLLRRRRK